MFKIVDINTKMAFILQPDLWPIDDLDLVFFLFNGFNSI